MTEAERLLDSSSTEIKDVAVRREVLDHAVMYTFRDGSSLHCRKLSGRYAFARNGWHLKSN